MLKQLNQSKSPSFRLAESAILLLCLSVLALRCLYTESPHVAVINPIAPLGAEALSLILSSVLIFAAFAWLILSLSSKNFIYHKTGIEIPAILFFLAGLTAIFFASNKRIAINDLAAIISAIITAILLIQLLDSTARIKILLMTIVALGIVNAYQCADQFFNANQQMIEAYEYDPDSQLYQQGIEPDTLQHFLYEHRIYSKDIRGFFTTSNSAGAFAICAIFAAIVLLTEKIRTRKHSQSAAANITVCSLAVIANAAGLVLTQSKGAISAFVIGIAMFAAFLIMGGWLKTHRKKIIIAAIAAVILATVAIIYYGTTYARLPGGNSMLVRWQYWQGAAKMYASHPFTGVGGGNFANYYTHYKIAAALETVRDPHNFILSLLTQYGPVGLVAFCACFVVVLCRSIFCQPAENLTPDTTGDKNFSLLAAMALFFILITLILIRPVFTADYLGEDPAGKLSAIVVLYGFPAGIFVLAYTFLWGSEKATAALSVPETFGPVAGAAIFSAICAVAIASCIDFAIFEPAVMTTFWSAVAICAAITNAKTQKPAIAIQLTTPKRLLVAVISLTAIWAYCSFSVVPTINSSQKTQRAMQDHSMTRQLLAAAAQADPLNPAPLIMCGKTYLGQYEQTEKNQSDLLTKAAECFTKAAELNDADFKNYEKLTEVHELLAEAASEAKGLDIQKAYKYSIEAVKRYPGSARLHIELALFAERLEKIDIAIEHYANAVRIEDDYRKMFKLMYPDRKKVVSRLTGGKYDFAKERIGQLTDRAD